MKKYIFIFLLLNVTIHAISQVTNLGPPIGWNGKLAHKNIPIETMIGFDQSIVDKEDQINEKTKENPWRFGYKYEVNYSAKNSGLETFLPNGDKLWQLVIECKGALTINLLFENFKLPKGAYLYLYDFNHTNKVGAYTFKNNRPDGELGTELVHGDKIIVEYFEPSNVIGQGSFNISSVIHGYRNIGSMQSKLTRALNSSGDCNIDVNCPLGNGWENEIRSVAMIVVGGNGICSGALINNTCNDGSPYFLTADHCLGGSTGSWAFRFNWESPEGTESCATTTGSVDPGPPYDQTANGATVLVNGGAADFALLELDNMTLSDAQNWNCYYAGWDATDATTITQATGIHHPSGDLKKICREEDSPYYSNIGGAAVWYIDEWEEGVTEPGSSGSPLFDQNHRIVGQLYGGLAACSGTVNNNEYDYYGRFGVSWNNGVSNYLASVNCGSATTNDGWDPNTPNLSDDAGISGILSPISSYCVDNFDPEITLRNYGSNNLTSVTIIYDIDGVNPNYFNWVGNLASGESENIFLPNITTNSGSHIFNVYTSLPNGNSDSNNNNDALSTNYTATVGGEDVLLELNLDCWGSEITWLIEDNNSNIIYSGGPYTDVDGGEYISTNLCLEKKCYNFIISDTYGDGMYGSQWGSCDIDGSYSLTEISSNEILAETMAENADFGNEEVNDFCIEDDEVCELNFSTNINNPLCLGIDNGSILVSIEGGNQSYNLQWNNGLGNSSELYNLSPGDYLLNISNSTFCDTNVSFNLTYSTALDLSLIANNTQCYNSSTGSIFSEITGGSGIYNYLWNNGETTSQISNLNTGTYSLTVTDENNCVIEQQVSVNSPDALVLDYVVNDAFCSNENNGSIVGVISGGIQPYVFQWSNGSNSQNIFNLTTDNYSLNVTDANGCVVDSVFNVQSEASPQTSDIVGPDQVLLFSENQYSVDESLGSYYNWFVFNGEIISNQGLESITVNWEIEGDGIVNVIETDINGCVGDTISLIVSVLDPCAVNPMQISFDNQDASCGVSNGSIFANVSGGNGDYSYQWNNGDTTSEIDDLPVGIYSLIVSDASGCNVSNFTNINSFGAPEINVNYQDLSCYESNDGLATVSVLAGSSPYYYSWSNGSNSPEINNLQAGSYVIAVTDSNNCSVTELVSISSPDQILLDFNISNVVCPEQDNGYIEGSVSGGVSPYLIEWSNGENSNDIYNLVAGNYFLTVTDQNGCLVDSTFIVETGQSPQTSEIIGSNQIFLNEIAQYYVSEDSSSYYTWQLSNGVILSGQGTNLITIQWNNIGSGYLNVIETSSQGCVGDTMSISVLVLDPCTVNPLDISSSSVNAICGVHNGSANVSVSGGNGTYIYQWSNGATSSEINNLSSGNYNILVTDTAGCTAVDTINIIAYDSPVLSTYIQNISCFGLSDGTINVTVSGGLAPYSYIWSNGNVGSQIDSLSEGSYNVTVTDNNGCSASENINISSAEEIIISYNVTNVDCPGQNSGSIQVEVSGGTYPYSYDWSNGEITSFINNLFIGDYSLIVTDANGCLLNSDFTLTSGEAPEDIEIFGPTSVVEYSSQQYIVSQVLGSTYNWFVENGAVLSGQGSNVVSVQWGNSGVGQLSVLETNENGCLGDTSNIFISIGVNGIKNNDNQIVKVYPNPTSRIVNVEVENYSGTVFTKVYDLIGNLIISNDTKIIDTQYFSRGVYLLEISFGNTVREMKLIRN